MLEANWPAFGLSWFRLSHINVLEFNMSKRKEMMCKQAPELCFG
jgi:hypothetical protein